MINIYYQNVRGLRSKTNNLYRQVRMNSYDVIIFTETWLLDSVSDNELFDGRYLVWRRDRDYCRTGQSRGGGVLIAVKNDLTVVERCDWRSTAEDIWISIVLKRSRPAMTSKNIFNNTISVVLFLQMAAQVLAGTQFASHVSVNTPARSFTHGVGDPLPSLARRNYNRQSSFRSLPLPQQTRGAGYPRVKPAIPFSNEDTFHRDNSLNGAPWQYNNYMDVAIPVLPPSPYKVDSPDPESLWPEGLFLPPFNSPRFGGASNRRSEVLSEAESLDPYLLEGSEAIAAVKRSSRHGLYYFHDIPHIESLLANQELRIENNLKPHRIASIRHTWPYNRP